MLINHFLISHYITMGIINVMPFYKPLTLFDMDVMSLPLLCEHLLIYTNINCSQLSVIILPNLLYISL